MHPSAAIALTFSMIYGPWAPLMVGPYVVMEMWRLSLAAAGIAEQAEERR